MEMLFWIRIAATLLGLCFFCFTIPGLYPGLLIKPFQG